MIIVGVGLVLAYKVGKKWLMLQLRPYPNCEGKAQWRLYLICLAGLFSNYVTGLGRGKGVIVSVRA